MLFVIVLYFLCLLTSAYIDTYSAFSRGTGAGLIHAIVAVFQLISVLALKVVHTATTVELTTEHLICLDETLELASEVGILAL